jgi:excisionase family DNA binding protein
MYFVTTEGHMQDKKTHPSEEKGDMKSHIKGDIMTAAEVAEFFRVSHKTVINRAVAGDIPGKQIGSLWRFSRKQIEQFI